MADGIRELGALLDLEQLDRDLFRGQNADHGRDPRVTLYGGQVAAQALAAAGRTVATDRLPHSLHGYFLRAGKPERPVLLQVDRDRDGGSFSARHVRAVQDGEVIFSMLASFQAPRSSAEVDLVERRTVPAPEDTPAAGWDRLLEVREVTLTAIDDPDDATYSDCAWVRSRSPLADDPLTMACGLTYLSDLGSGFGQRRDDGLPRGGSSIDHAMWFHAPIRADDWVLLDLHPTKARSSRALYDGSITDRHGTLGAVLQQELLLRQPRRDG